MNYESAFPKGKRKRDRKLLAKVRRQPCLICFKTPSDPAHVQSVGAGGDDTESNLVPLCRDCHQEQHRIGIKSFAERYPAFRDRYQAFLAWREGIKK